MDLASGQVLAYLLWMTGVGIFVKARWVRHGLGDLPYPALCCWVVGGLALTQATLGTPALAVGAWIGAGLACTLLWLRLFDLAQMLWQRIMTRERPPADETAWRDPTLRPREAAMGVASPPTRDHDPEGLRNETDAERSQRLAKMFSD